MGTKNGGSPLVKADKIPATCMGMQGQRMEGLELSCGDRMQGFASNSLWRALGSLGISGQTRRTLIAKAGDQAERASNWLWRKESGGLEMLTGSWLRLATSVGAPLESVVVGPKRSMKGNSI